MKRLFIPSFLFLAVIFALSAEFITNDTLLCQCGCHENGSDEIPADEDLS